MNSDYAAGYADGFEAGRRARPTTRNAYKPFGVRHCEVCGRKLVEQKWRFCPKCGAKIIYRRQYHEPEHVGKIEGDDWWQ